MLKPTALQRAFQLAGWGLGLRAIRAQLRFEAYDQLGALDDAAVRRELRAFRAARRRAVIEALMAADAAASQVARAREG